MGPSHRICTPGVCEGHQRVALWLQFRPLLCNLPLRDLPVLYDGSILGAPGKTSANELNWPPYYQPRVHLQLRHQQAESPWDTMGCWYSSLRRYMHALHWPFSWMRVHARGMVEIFRALKSQEGTYETIAPAIIREILWQIFIDARLCVSSSGSELPKTRLKVMAHFVRACTIQLSVNYPAHDLLMGMPQFIPIPS